MTSGGKWYTSLMRDGSEMIVNIAWLVESSDVQMLCSTPEKVDTIVRTILQDGGYIIADFELYEHIRLSLRNIDNPKESYIPLDYDYPSVADCESIKITRLQLL